MVVASRSAFFGVTITGLITAIPGLTTSPSLTTSAPGPTGADGHLRVFAGEREAATVVAESHVVIRVLHRLPYEIQ